jgi:hypothetical protein
MSAYVSAAVQAKEQMWTYATPKLEVETETRRSQFWSKIEQYGVPDVKHS